jgi:multidrug/hemolysin transport system permease protein
MSNIFVLAKRNALLFLRDRSAVFFSFLSSLIIVALYILFIANLYTAGLNENEYAAAHFDSSALDFIVYAQMMAGVLIVNSLTLSGGAFTTIAKDFETGKADSFRLTPASVPQIVLSYFGGGFVTSFGLNVFTWLAAFGLIGALTGYWVTAATFFAVLGVCALASLVSCAIMMMITVIVKSSTAVSVGTSVGGTFIGFLSGIYMPFTALGAGVESVGSVLPFTHLAIWTKQVVLGDVYGQLGMPAEIQSALNVNFSVYNVGFLSLDIPLWAMMIYTAAFAAVCLVIGGLSMNRRFSA